MVQTRKDIKARIRELDAGQWVVLVAIVVVVAGVVALVGPGLMPKPAPIPEAVPQTAITSSPTTATGAKASAVSSGTVQEVLGAMSSDGVVPTDPTMVKMTYGNDENHVTVYGEFDGKLQSYVYVLQSGKWQQQ